MLAKTLTSRRTFLAVLGGISAACAPTEDSHETAEQAASVVDCTPPAPGIIAWWPGDGNAIDISGGKNGVVQNGTSFVQGQDAEAFRFTTSGDMVRIPSDPAFNLEALAESTLEGWFLSQPTSASPNGRVVIGKHTCGITAGWFFASDEGCFIGDHHVGGVGLGGLNVNDGQFHHFACVKDGSSYREYIDGALVTADGGPAYGTSVVESVQIGSLDTGTCSASPAQLYGLADELTIYGRALTSAEIQDIRNAGKCKRKKVVILAQGINTSLSCDASGDCTPGDELGSPQASIFGPLRAALVAGGLEEGDNLLWYSYKGGSLDISGSWRSNSYHCSDTAQPYEASITSLAVMMRHIAVGLGKVDFYLVGHSQGGLIAFQSLGLALDLAGSPTGGFPEDSRVRGVFTLDSPLGGTPNEATTIPARYTCWNGTANRQMDRLYESNRGTNARQGDLAEPLCRQVGKCQGAETNLLMANNASVGLDVKVVTFGASRDAVYDPAACFPPIARAAARRWFGDNLSSQVVSTMPGGIQPEPDFYTVLDCDSLESSIVLDIVSLPINPGTLMRLSNTAPEFSRCLLDCISKSHSWIRARAYPDIVDFILQR
jgi:pimeloyl-ACP methyl ester carboxylesterase